MRELTCTNCGHSTFLVDILVCAKLGTPTYGKKVKFNATCPKHSDAELITRGKDKV